MAEKFVPMRPKDDKFQIKAIDKDIITYQVAFGVSEQSAFELFHPELCENGKLTKLGRDECRQVFKYAKNREYADAYRETLKAVLSGKGGEDGALVSDERKENALKKLLNQAMKLVEGGESLDADGLKTVSDIFKKIGLLKDDVEVAEVPRRYLPVQCNDCAYKAFVESHKKNGAVECLCTRCRALKVAQDVGFVYNEKNLLE